MPEVLERPQVTEQQVMPPPVKEPKPPITREPRRPKLIRWIALGFGAVAIAVAVVVGFMLAGDDEPFVAPPIDEAASELTIGARHSDPAFDVGFRWVGESDGTAEYLVPLGFSARPWSEEGRGLQP